MKGRTIFTALATILLVSMVIVSAVGSAQDPSYDTTGARTDVFEDRALQHIAQTQDIPIEQLSVVYKTQAHYRMIDKKLWCMKISDHKSDEMYAASMDMDGNIVDESEIKGQDSKAYTGKYGKLEPALYDRLRDASGEEMIKVGIWLTPIDGERIEKEILSKCLSGNRPVPDDKEGRMGGGSAVRNEIFAAKKEAYALKEKPVIDHLKAKGFEIIYASFSAPLIFAELPREEIIALGGRDDIGKIYLSKLCEPEADTAIPTIRAHKVWNEGYDGTGTKVAIVEWAGVDFANPYLSGIMRPSPSGVGAHATECAGIVASTHPTYKGVAYGTTILSANADSWWDSDLIEASDWAIGESADVLSCSFHSLENDPFDLRMDHLDRYYDHVIWEHHRAVSKSAGNNNGNVTSPGLAYNVITVGGTDDMDTPDWDDDERAPFSSYVDPISPHGDRDKPEVSAVAERIQSTETEAYFIGNGTWITKPSDKKAGTSYAAPAVAGMIAALIDRDVSLRDYPEVSKAVIMASAIHDTYDGGTSHPSWAIDDKEGTGTVVASQAYNTVNNNWKQGFSHLTQSNFPMDITFYAAEGEDVRFVTCWDSHTNWDVDNSYDMLMADLDLKIYDPSGGYIDGSYTWDRNFEVVDFTAPVSGTYKAHIIRWQFDADYERLGAAWSRTSLPVEYTFTDSVSQGSDSVKHNFDVPFECNRIYTTLDMPSGTDFDLSVWDDQNRRTGGWLSTESHNRYDIPNSGYSGYAADPEWVDVSPPATSGAWDTGCYAFYGSGTYTMTVEVTP